MSILCFIYILFKETKYPMQCIQLMFTCLKKKNSEKIYIKNIKYKCYA